MEAQNKGTNETQFDSIVALWHGRLICYWDSVENCRTESDAIDVMCDDLGISFWNPIVEMDKLERVITLEMSGCYREPNTCARCGQGWASEPLDAISKCGHWFHFKCVGNNTTHCVICGTANPFNLVSDQQKYNFTITGKIAGSSDTITVDTQYVVIARDERQKIQIIELDDDVNVELWANPGRRYPKYHTKKYIIHNGQISPLFENESELCMSAFLLWARNTCRYFLNLKVVIDSDTSQISITKRISDA